ncbi:MAG: hypothetical protein A2808_02100 [Candidatus Moranbacteria bacterium RIFCSPHIGHO2_01_FULL_55_24]|nr:MAG: hypothetical protein A2808_02100 [Candidatus Moranbacteria bacterium RIFCSPHIGHO2_01_FULL_55_24]
MSDDALIRRASNIGEERAIVIQVAEEDNLLIGFWWSLGVAIAVALLVNGIISLLTGGLHDLKLFGMSLQYIFVALFGLFIGSNFFRRGLRIVKIAHRGIPIFLGRREEKKIFREGWCWHWPEPLGKVLEVSIEKRNLDINPSEVLDKEGLPITVNISLTYKVESISLFLNVEDPVKLLQLEAEDQIRDDVADMPYDDLAKKRQDFANNLQEKLQKQMEKTGTGILICDIQIAGIRLPEKLEAAKTKIAEEKAEADSDMADTATLARQVKHLMEAGGGNLSVQEALAAVQASRGERTVVTLEGGSPLAQAGAAAGLMNNLTQEQKTDEDQLQKNLRQRRRQKQEKK